MSDKAREEFEAWAASDGYQLDASSDARFTYDFHETECAWYGWQASRASPVVNACAGMADPAAEITELKRQRDELLAALHDAATSLETIQLRSFGADSYLDDKHSMRAYAGARAAVAREAMGKTKGSSS